MKKNPHPDAANLTPDPLYEKTTSYTIKIPNNQGSIYETDIYYPISSRSNTENLPVILFLQGGLVDKSDYSNYANIVSRYGFLVAIPNCNRRIPELNTEGLLVHAGVINDILTYFKKIKQSDDSSPIRSIVDTSNLLLAGHSWGGTVGLSAINNTYTPILYVDDFQRPDELKAAVFFDTTLPEIDKNFQPTDNFVPIKNDDIPIAILENSLNKENSEKRRKTYESIKNSPKAFITVLGTNHYGITNEDNPNRRKNIPFLEQKIATETIARWSALFLRATVLDDLIAKEYVFKAGDSQDKNVIVNIS